MIHRRLALLAAGGAIPAPALLRPARAQGPAAAPATPQAPGFYRFMVGSLAVTTVHDGFFSLPIDRFVRNAPLPEVQAAFRDAFLPTDRAFIPFTVTFVQRGETLVAFDVGNGVTPSGATAGRMIANMAAAGIDPMRVTHVIHSHFHGDHINGLLNAEGGRAFPNAEVLVPAPEWDWWTDEANQARSPEGQRGTFANVARRFAPYRDRVRSFQPGAEVIPGITSIAAYGHTPGHTIFRVADGSEQFIFLADVTNRPEVLMAHPDWQIVFDFDGDAAAATRRRVLDMVATDRIRVTGYHYPFPANGHVARAGSGFRFVPADWSSAV
ncbi:MBL fold metallo-hydrolase [Roseomonas eburnea]|uniref:MBL fold metallo-hydrolase n=1 Tax=Neoroseomonas eburnea TaxID=1346889 RepID=A0A9X9XF16_9PROT|nr:MBL fold metallo-hydrolase [Neoroseomonas eburnea]MBR0682302.1 MBL fold metallo-hydrolase [Neoroseomonas eburnea]